MLVRTCPGLHSPALLDRIAVIVRIALRVLLIRLDLLGCRYGQSPSARSPGSWSGSASASGSSSSEDPTRSA